MSSFEQLDFEATAKQVFDQFLVLRPLVPVEGLFRAAKTYFIVAPSATPDDAAGQTLLHWFDTELKTLGYPITLVAERPVGSEEVPTRRAREVIEGLGVVRTRSALQRDLALAVPDSIPLLSVREEQRVAVVRVGRALTTEESAVLGAAFERLGAPLPMRVQVQLVTDAVVQFSPNKVPTDGHDLALVPARLLQTDTPRAVRHMVSEDDDFWRRRVSRGEFLREGTASARPINWEASSRSCLIGTTFAPANLRTYLSLYSSVFLVAPLATNLDQTISALGLPRPDLLELSRRGVVRWLLPQSVDRYDLDWLADLFEAAPESVMLSRRLAVLAAEDQSRRNPLLRLPGGAFERRALLRGLLRSSERVNGAAALVLRALASALSDHWAMAEYTMHTRGAMSSVSGGLARFACELGKAVFGKDLFVELSASAQHVEWAGALGAHVVPEQGTGYSSEKADGFLVALSSGVSKEGVRTATAREFELAEEVLAFDNDTNVMEFVTELGSGDLARFRDVVAGLAKGVSSDGELREHIRNWNAQVRHYERRPDRIKSFNLVGIVLAGASQLSANDAVRSVVPVLAPLMPLVLTHLTEDVVRESPAIGRLADWANAALAGAAPEAVLLSRMRKRVAGMRDR